MREAVIVSTARTPIGKAFRGAFNDTEAPAMGGHVVRAAVERAGIDVDFYMKTLPRKIIMHLPHILNWN